ncbi:hypothetical protein QQS21_010618 [Conoideocrella luteorostrata]|uniref:AA1-like domain-containing protein n=1 Tax=Conoideocrella luteorostrata TaxID=1105319 RepID=A0AAJ0CJ41_9HYPO|nr:hypothetical protein QQS21_010618 [Conoideocrella luteorostrata]
MKFSLIFLAALPVALASSLAYTPPPALMARAKENPTACAFPNEYRVSNFEGQTNNNGTTLSAYKFTFINPATNSTTACKYDEGSTPEKSANGIPRFACNNKAVTFSWSSEQQKLAVIQSVCPGSNGQAEYEVSGTVPITVSCVSGQCKATPTSFNGVFSNLKAVKRSSVVRKHRKRGVAWSYDIFN